MLDCAGAGALQLSGALSFAAGLMLGCSDAQLCIFSARGYDNQLLPALGAPQRSLALALSYSDVRVSLAFGSLWISVAPALDFGRSSYWRSVTTALGHRALGQPITLEIVLFHRSGAPCSLPLLRDLPGTWHVQGVVASQLGA